MTSVYLYRSKSLFGIFPSRAAAQAAAQAGDIISDHPTVFGQNGTFSSPSVTDDAPLETSNVPNPLRGTPVNTVVGTLTDRNGGVLNAVRP